MVKNWSCTLLCTVSAQIEACACSNNRLTTLKQSCETGAFIIYHLVWPCWIQLQGLVRKQKVNKAVNQLPVPSLQLTLGQTWLDTSRRMDIFDTRCVAASWRIWNANHCKPRSVMICAQSTWEVWGATTAKPDALETKKNLQTEVTLKACHDMSDLMVLLTGLPLQN